MRYDKAMKSYSRRLVKKRRFRVRVAAGLAGFVVIGYSSAILLWPLQAVEATLVPLPPVTTTATPLAWPSQGQSAIGSSADGVLVAKNTDDRPVPMASITKLVTALTVLEVNPLAAGEPGPTITLSASDAARYSEYVAKNGSVAPATAGQQISQRHMLDAMLVASANNYADTLALWAYGTPEAYLAAANGLLEKHQLTDTAVADMTGFSPDSKSTARDLVKLGAIALNQPAISEIVSQKSVTIPDVGTLQNTNILLGSDGVNGIKTGTTDEAGSCLLFSATHKVGAENVTIIGVILGAPNHSTLFNQVKTLLASAKPNFQSVTLVKTSQPIGTYTAPWGATAQAAAQATTAETLWAGTKVSQHATLQAIQPGDSGTVGALITKVKDQTYTTNVTLDTPLTSPTWHWRLTHPLEVF